MGYPQFNKTTIQLPLPDSTLTKAEYKAAYGVDLDAIDFPKVTLLIDGNNKYPVDEIKIVSDDVLIFAGGKILTIGDDGNVSVTTGAYSVENAKPIYCHPITIFSTLGNLTLSCMIFNSSPTPYTMETFIAEIKTWVGRLICNGKFKDTNHVYDVQWVQYYENKVLLRGSIDDVPMGYAPSPDLEVILDSVNDVSFVDSVNKIN